MQIEEIHNENFPKITPVKECMNIFIPDIIDENIPRRNGSIWVICGSGGSGKTSLMLNFFKNKQLYKNKFHNIYYFCPESSFLSVKNHPFKNHDKLYHELNFEILTMLYDTLSLHKTTVIDNIEKKKNKNHINPIFDDDDKNNNNDDDDDIEIKYNCVIFDDMANFLKNKDIDKALNKLLIKARHLNTMFIFTLQSYIYFPKTLRKQITYLTMFKPKNYEEWSNISHELFNLNKNDALILYNYVFNANYNHLDYDTIENKYYKNFNKLIFSKD